MRAVIDGMEQGAGFVEKLQPAHHHAQAFDLSGEAEHRERVHPVGRKGEKSAFPDQLLRVPALENDWREANAVKGERCGEPRGAGAAYPNARPRLYRA